MQAKFFLLKNYWLVPAYHFNHCADTSTVRETRFTAHCIYTTAGAARSAGADAFAVSSFRGEQVHRFAGFISADGKNIANSIYTGELTVL